MFVAKDCKQVDNMALNVILRELPHYTLVLLDISCTADYHIHTSCCYYSGTCQNEVMLSHFYVMVLRIPRMQVARQRHLTVKRNNAEETHHAWLSIIQFPLFNRFPQYMTINRLHKDPCTVHLHQLLNVFRLQMNMFYTWGTLCIPLKDTQILKFRNEKRKLF